MSLHSGGRTFHADVHIRHLQHSDPLVSKNGIDWARLIAYMASMQLKHAREHFVINPTMAVDSFNSKVPPVLRVTWALLVLKLTSATPMWMICSKWTIIFPIRPMNNLPVKLLNLSNANVVSSGSVVIAYTLRLEGKSHGVVLRQLFASTLRVYHGLNVLNGISPCVGPLWQCCNGVIV